MISIQYKLRRKPVTTRSSRVNFVPGRARSRVRIVRIAARCPRAKSRVFVRRHILFACRFRVVDIPSRARVARLVRVSHVSHASITYVARRLRVIIIVFAYKHLC
jgi:hypothetical protein